MFAVASALCSAAVAPGMLVASRFVQGAGEALAGPAALGLIALLFADPKERMKALGIWGGVAGLGGVCGKVISGALTDLASWRWIFFINLPVALFALVMVPRLVSESVLVLIMLEHVTAQPRNPVAEFSPDPPPTAPPRILVAR